MKKNFSVFYFLAAVSIAVAVFAPNVRAYDGCKTCHGGFRDSSYKSLKDGVAWGDDLHDVHRNVMLSRECEACHSLKPDGSGRLNSPVYNGRAEGESSKGLAPLSCNGCHGRQEDGGFDDAGGNGYGAGLRQQHTRAGEYDCTDCHSDADPESFTVAGENILPPYYRDATGVFALIPRDACNPGGFEDFAAATIGLDNDGDGLYDLDDPDCQEIEMCTDNDNDGFVVSDGICEIPAGKQAGDCNDTNAGINPDASEICSNDIDEDCNNEDLICDPCQDLDGDNYHDPAFPAGCVMPADSLGEDCNDSDADTNPGASEICGNDTDEDCNGIAETCLPCQDSDGDSYHNPDSSPRCTIPDGSLGVDCNDSNFNINPGAPEICDDHDNVDEDCNGLSNNADPVCINQGDSDYDFLRIRCPGKVTIVDGSDGTKIRFAVIVRNNGNTDPGALLLVKAMQDGEMIPIAETGISVEPGASKTFRFNVLATTPGEMDISAEITDDDTDNDTIMCTVSVNQKKARGGGKPNK